MTTAEKQEAKAGHTPQKGDLMVEALNVWQKTGLTTARTYEELAAWALRLRLRASHSGSGSTQSSGPNWI